MKPNHQTQIRCCHQQSIQPIDYRWVCINCGTVIDEPVFDQRCPIGPLRVPSVGGLNRYESLTQRYTIKKSDKLRSLYVSVYKSYCGHLDINTTDISPYIEHLLKSNIRFGVEISCIAIILYRYRERYVDVDEIIRELGLNMTPNRIKLCHTAYLLLVKDFKLNRDLVLRKTIQYRCQLAQCSEHWLKIYQLTKAYMRNRYYLIIYAMYQILRDYSRLAQAFKMNKQKLYTIIHAMRHTEGTEAIHYA